MLQFKKWLEAVEFPHPVNVYGVDVTNSDDMRRELFKQREHQPFIPWLSMPGDYEIQSAMARAISKVYSSLELFNKLVEVMRKDMVVVNLVRSNLKDWDEHKFWRVIEKLKQWGIFAGEDDDDPYFDDPEVQRMWGGKSVIHKKPQAQADVDNLSAMSKTHIEPHDPNKTWRGGRKP